MKRLMIAAAASAAMIVLSASGPAQARMADPALNLSAPNVTVQEVQYRRHHRWHRHYRHRHRHCWNDRVRVRTPVGTFVYRTVRRCGWRYRYY